MQRIMKIVFRNIAFLLLIFAGAACGPTLSPLTQRLINENNWSETEFKRIQFYLSEDIVMQRALSGSETEIISGEIKVVDGRKVEEIRIPKGTPGVFSFAPKSQRMAVSFEDGSDRYLVFGPNPKAGDRYVLLASDWNRNYGKVTYEGRKFRVNSRAAYAALMVDLKKTRKVQVNSRTAKGQRVD